MRQEMLPKLAQFFKEKGLLNRPEYRASTETPYTLREVERVFKRYASMLYEVEQYNLLEKSRTKVEHQAVKPTVRKLTTKKKSTKEEDSLDGKTNST